MSDCLTSCIIQFLRKIMSENIISISFKIHSWMVKLLWEVRLHLALKAEADLRGCISDDGSFEKGLIRRPDAKNQHEWQG